MIECFHEYDVSKFSKLCSYKDFVLGLAKQKRVVNVLEIGSGTYPSTMIEITRYFKECGQGKYFCIESTYNVDFHLQNIPKENYCIKYGDSADKELWKDFPLFDVICIDGYHDENYAYQDLSNSILKIKDDSVIILHDVRSCLVRKGIEKFLNEYPFPMNMTYLFDINIGILTKPNNPPED